MESAKCFALPILLFLPALQRLLWRFVSLSVPMHFVECSSVPYYCKLYGGGGPSGVTNVDGLMAT